MKMRLNMEDVNEWRSGKLIQNALPYLTKVEREFLMTGMSAEEQKQFFDMVDEDE